jgi:CO/xanthine dehydrogenase FAD-binding subunit
MHLWNHYHTPASVDEALELLAHYDGAARIVAGGTDLLLEIRQGRRPPQEALIDITRIPELGCISHDADGIYLGAAVTHSRVVNSPLLAAHTTCLVESCGMIGGPQVRNVGTLGGNVAHALPAGDGTTSLVTLDAEVEIVAQGERRWVHILQMFKGPGRSLIDPTRDLLLGFRSGMCREREASAFKRVMRPQGVALPVLGCAVWVRLSADGSRYDDARVCIGPAGPTPMRAEAVEDALRGQPVGDKALTAAVEAAHASLHPRTSKYRASAEYRAQMIEVLLRRALPLAVQRARTGQATPEGVGLQ